MGKKKVTIKDIAAEIGVSKSLVSFVLNGKSKEKRISKEMTQKVLAVAKKLNYKPNYLAKSLRIGKSHTIALILADISNPFFAKFARHLEIEASKYNYKVIFANSDEKKSKFSEELAVLQNREVDGFILFPPIGSEKDLMELKKHKVPFVIVDRYFKDINSHVVNIDNYEAGYKATQRLIENNCSRIGILNVNNELYTMSQRIKGYEDALLANKIELESDLVKNLKFSHEKQLIMDAILELIEVGVNGLIFTTSKLTVLGIECLRELKIRIPQDIAIMSFDDMDAYRITFTPISAVVQPIQEMSKSAIKLLIKTLDSDAEEEEYEKIVHKVEFIYRDSCL